MHRSRHPWILLAVATLVVGLAAPATAGKGGSPGGPEPQSVTVELVGDFATSCGESPDEPLPLTMTLDGKMLIMDWADTAVEMKLVYPTGPTDPDGFTMTGCHGPLVGVVGASPDDVFSGNFALVQQRDGTVKLSSRFDYFWEFEGGPGNRDVQKTLELYSVNGNLTPSEDFVWSSPGGGELSGEVLLKRFEKVYKDGEWTEAGTFPVEITVTISD